MKRLRNSAARIALCVGFVLSLSTETFAQSRPDKPCADGKALLFSDYSVDVSESSQRAKLDLGNTFAREYRTRLREGLSSEPVNFAGHFVMVTFGCGTTCLYGGWVDVRTGKATPLPFLLNSFGTFGIEDPLLYEPDSRLVVMDGIRLSEEGAGARYFYEWTETKLEPVCYVSISVEIESSD